MQVMFQQDHVGRFLCHIHRRIHRQADIRRMQRGRIVDAVAQVADHMAARPERLDHAVLLRRIDPAEQVRRFYPGTQSVVVHLLDLLADHHTRDRNLQLGADMPRDQIAVAGHDLDRDARLLQRGQCGSSALLGGIEKGGKSGQHQFRFVAHHGMRVVQRHLAPGNAQHAEAFLFQRVILVAYACQRRIVDRALQIGAIRFVTRAQPHDLVGCAFHHQPASSRRYRSARRRDGARSRRGLRRSFSSHARSMCVWLRMASSSGLFKPLSKKLLK